MNLPHDAAACRRYDYRMDIRAIVDRITQRIDEMRAAGVEVSARSISIQAKGNPDVIRNLKRAAEAGGPGGAHAETLTALADALDVSLQWLVTGETATEQDSRSRTVIAELNHIVSELDDKEADILLSVARILQQRAVSKSEQLSEAPLDQKGRGRLR